MALPLLLLSWAVILLTGFVGFRLARPAWAIKSLPEGLMAAFFLVAGPIGYGALMLRTTFGLSAESAELARAVATVAFLVPAITVVLFTWKVFRPEATWARNLAIVYSAWTLAAHVLAHWLAGPLGLTEALSIEPGTTFYWISTVIRASGFAWACLEASLYYAKARRRVSIGLADPMVANRFFLWALWSGAATTMVVLRVWSAFVVDVNSPNPTTPLWLLLPLIGAGLVSVVAIWLTFAPPAFYRRYLTADA